MRGTCCTSAPILVRALTLVGVIAVAMAAQCPQAQPNGDGMSISFNSGTTASLDCALMAACGPRQTVRGNIARFEGGRESILRIVDELRDILLDGASTSRNTRVWANRSLSMTLSVRRANTVLELTYSCLPDQFSAFGCPNGRTPLTGYPMLLGTDLDGDDSSVRAPEAICEYSIECPDSMLIEIHSMRVRLSSSSSIEVIAPDDPAEPLTPTTSMRPFGLAPTSFSMDNVPLLHSKRFQIIANIRGGAADHGFILNYTCAFPQVPDAQSYACSSKKAAPVVLTGFPGVLGSDLDGAGAFRYSGNLVCVWNIICPPEHVVHLIEYHASLASNDAVELFTLGPHQHVEGQIGDFRGLSRRDLPLSNAIHVAFKSTGTNTGNGFELRFNCTPAAQFIGCPRNFTHTLASTGGTFLIGSDVDGGGEIQYPHNTDCRWRIRCADPTQTLFAEQVRMWRNGGDFVALLNNDSATPANNDGRAGALLDGYPLANEVIVEAFADQSGNDRGFDMRFRCRAADPFAVMICPHNAVITRFPVRIGTDLDGDGPWKYGNYMQCRWHLQCPRGEGLQLSAIEGDFGTGDWLSFIDPLSGRTAASTTWRTAMRNAPLFVSSNSLVVNFDSDHSGRSTGFGLNASCVPIGDVQLLHFGCPWNETIFVSDRGLIGSDIDGAGEFPYGNNLECHWNLQCEAPGKVVALDSITQRFGSGDSLEIYSVPAGSPAWAESRSVVTPPVGSPPLVLSSAIGVRWTTNPTGFDAGWSLRFHCVTATSFVGCPVMQHISVYPGIIGTDLDGVGSQFHVPSDSECRWNITCPVGFVVEFASLRAMVRSSDSLFVTTDQLDGADVMMAGDASGDTALRTADNIQVARSILLHWRSGRQLSSHGFTANYTCSRPTQSLYFGCPRNAVIRQFPGRIGSDMDGAGAFRYSTNVQCKWLLSCPPGMVVGITEFVAQLQGGDELQLWSPRRNSSETPGYTVTLQDVPVNATRAPWLIANEVEVWFAWGRGAVDRGFTIGHTCVSTTVVHAVGCFSDRDAVLRAEEGMIGTDVDGSDELFQTPVGLRCQWEVECPLFSVATIRHFKVALRGVDTLEFYTIDDAGGLSEEAAISPNRTLASSLSGSTAVPSGQLLSRRFALSLTTANSGNRDGFSLRYSCQRRWGSFGCSSNMSVNFFPASVGTDMDGSGTNTPFVGGTCVFHLVCPAGGQVRIITAHLVTPTGVNAGRVAFFTAHPANDAHPFFDEWSGVVSADGRTMPASLNYTGNQSVYVRVVLSSGGNSNGGFDLTFDCDCAGTRCPLPPIPKTPTATIPPTPSASATLQRPPTDTTSASHSLSTTVSPTRPATGETPTRTGSSSPIAPSTPPPSTTPPSTPPPTPPPIPRKPREVEAVQTTTQVTTVAAGMVNPAVAAQTARSGVVLELLQCDFDLDEDLDWADSPTGLSFIVGDVARKYIGAVVANVAIISGALAVHYLVGMFFIKSNVAESTELLFETRKKKALAKVRFPAGSFMILSMFFMQPTIASAVTVCLHASTIAGRLVGGASILVILLGTAAVGLWMRKNFHAAWLDQAGHAMHRSRFRAFIEGCGKWTDDTGGHIENEGFVKQYGAFFSDFGDGKAFFGMVEIVVCIVCGVIEGWKTNVLMQCRALIATLIGVYVVYTALLLYHRPHGTNYDFAGFLLVALLQLASAVLAVLRMIPNHDVISQHCAVASMLLATAKAAVDLVREAYRFRQRRAMKKRLHKGDAGSNDKAGVGSTSAPATPQATGALASPLLSVPDDDNEDLYNEDDGGEEMTLVNRASSSSGGAWRRSATNPLAFAVEEEARGL